MMSGKEIQSQPSAAREFARWIIERLTEAGHQALLAGGCVRDQLLGKTPKDYDVATSATPDQVRDIFGHRRTIPVGAAFGVITVVGDKTSGNVEVATFRCDGGYSDGRHPDQVTFSNAEHDAERRDFTINGLFYDPLTETVIDFVKGTADLDSRLVRAIGNPADRFHEDHLRMLRAVRFATVLEFDIEPATLQAIQKFAHEIRTVSGERIAAEMQRILANPRRGQGLILLQTAGLLPYLLPQWELRSMKARLAFDSICRHLNQSSILDSGLEVSLSLVTLGQLLVTEPESNGVSWSAILLRMNAVTNEIVRTWKLANESKAVFRAVQLHLGSIAQARQLPWSQLQPVLVAPKIGAVLDVATGLVSDGWIASDDVQLCREHLNKPVQELNPPPFLTGDELKAQGMPEGPRLGRLLIELRRKQLDAEITTAANAWDWIRKQE